MPGAHASQRATPSAMNPKPAMHTQNVLPAVDVELDGQGAQLVMPSPKKPEMHEQVALLAADVEFAGHGCLSDVPPAQ